MSEDIKNNLNSKLENSQVVSHNELRPGVHSLELAVGENGRKITDLAYLTGENGQVPPVQFKDRASEITRDYIRRVDLDLLTGKPDPAGADPTRIYDKALSMYRTGGPYGTVIDTLTNFTAKGFKNDIDDPDVKLFYDTWTREIDFQNTVEKIIFDYFRVGMVRTFKLVGKFDPKIKPDNFDTVVKSKTEANVYRTNSTMKRLSAQYETAAAKKIWSKRFIPLKYTVLDPRLVEIQGPLLFDQSETYLKPQAFKEMRDLLTNPDKATDLQKEMISKIPKDLQEQIKSNKPVLLPAEYVGKCDYRRQDYERYAMPRSLRTFDLDYYKDSLIKADFSTLDGITNYMLKITVGTDEHPVTDQAVLETVARLFDTSSKSFNVVWNHTLDIEKITFPEISSILGKDKFEQVEDDLSMAWGVSRALLDGKLQSNSEAIKAATKSFIEEVNFARRSVTRWINNEYEEVALAMGFSQYPKVRFDDLALKDEIMMMSVIQGMIDRRILSYESGIEKLGFDFPTELANMMQEAPMVQAGYLGIIGSPYNSKALPPSVAPGDKDSTPEGENTVVTLKDLQDFQKNMQEMLQEGLKNIQPTQRTPTGTPSEGRPRTGGKGKPRQPSSKPNIKPKKPNTGISS